MLEKLLPCCLPWDTANLLESVNRLDSMKQLEESKRRDTENRMRRI